jgi:subtilisin family serine protease
MHALGKFLVGSLILWSSAVFGQVFTLDTDHVPNQLIVKFADNLDKADVANQLAEMGAVKVKEFRSSGAMLVEFQEKGGAMLLTSRAQTLINSSKVKFVEPNGIIRINRLPNDARFGELYGLHNEGSTGGTSGSDIDAPEAWDITTGSKDVVVGIIDTGVDYTHPDIAPNYWSNPGETGLDAQGNDKSTNGIDDDANGYIDDFRGWDFANDDNDPIDDHNHGTHCAGTIGGAGNDGVGVVGVNWEVSMVGLKFLTGGGSGTTDDAIEAIEYATTLGLTMTSNSWGGGGYSEAMDLAIQEADKAGILFIAAAGNSTANNDETPHYPSSYSGENIIAVAATDHNDGIANFSSYGQKSVHLGAPGVDILSSVRDGKWEKFSGTSMATPHVAGAAALVKSAFPNATAAEIKARLLNTVDPVASMQGKTTTGGRLNVANALEVDTVAPNSPSNILVSGAGLATVDLSWNAAGDDGATGFARRYEIRTSSAPIRNAGDWDSANVVEATMDVTPGRTAITGSIVNLAFNTSGFLAIRATDNVGNVGPVSASVQFATLQVQMVAENRAESMSGVTADAPWELEAAPARNGQAFSDSPGAEYANDLDVSLTLDAVNISDPNVVLVFQTKYDMENGYDFLYVEVATNGSDWTELAKITGASTGWAQKRFDLSDVAAGASQIQVRFRVTTDSSITKQGALIDDIQLFAPLP